MAELFLAQDNTAGALVVLKRILPYLAHEDEFVQMFLDEARIASMLNHPNIVKVFELGNLEGSIYIAMEYVEGIDLRTLLSEETKRGGQVPYGLAAYLVAQLCRGLHYAHTAKDLSGKPLHIVHRDVSPQNVMVGFDASLKLVDFGIAKAGAFMERSKPGVIKGKFLYLAPEQLSQESTDHRADIFAIGTLLYELTTGKSPFAKNTTEAVIYAIRSEEPAPPYSLRPGYPKELARIVSRCLVKDRTRRYSTAAEVQADLERFLRMTERTTANDVVQYVAGLFGAEDERTLIHIPLSGLLEQVDALTRDPPTSPAPIVDDPGLPFDPETTVPSPVRAEKLMPAPRQSTSAPVARHGNKPTGSGTSRPSLEFTPIAPAPKELLDKSVRSRAAMPPVPSVSTPPVPDAAAPRGRGGVSQRSNPPVASAPPPSSRMSIPVPTEPRGVGPGQRVTSPPRAVQPPPPPQKPRTPTPNPFDASGANFTAFDEPNMPTAIHSLPTDFREHLLTMSGTVRGTRWFDAPDVRMWVGLGAAFVLLVSGFLLWALRTGSTTELPPQGPEAIAEAAAPETKPEPVPIAKPQKPVEKPVAADEPADTGTPGVAATDPAPTTKPAVAAASTGTAPVAITGPKAEVSFNAPTGTVIAADDEVFEPNRTYTVAAGVLHYRFVCPGKSLQIHTQTEVGSGNPQTLPVDCG